MICDPAADDPSELAWFKSSYSDGPEGDSCVEIAMAPRVVHVRDSKVGAGPGLAVGARSWAAFVAHAAEG